MRLMLSHATTLLFALLLARPPITALLTKDFWRSLPNLEFRALR
jgi:hypothetical protein